MFRFVFNFLAAKLHISFHSAKFYGDFFTFYHYFLFLYTYSLA